MLMKISLDICSLTILGIILIILAIKNSIPLQQNKIFAITVWLAVLSTFADLLGELWQVWPDAARQHFPVYIHNAINYVYFLARNLLPFFYLRYVIAVLHIRRTPSAYDRFYMYFPLTVVLLLLASTPFTDAVFYINQAGMYCRGPGLPILYICSCYYLMLTIVLTFYYRNTIPLYRVLAFCLFVVISLAGSFAQFLFPYIAFESFGVAICLLLIYLTIQRPEEILDGMTGLLNRSAFSLMMAMDLKNRKNFQICVVIVDEYSFWVDSLGLQTVDRLFRLIADYLTKRFRDIPIFRIADDRFCLLLGEKSEITAEEILEKIQRRFYGSWFVEDFQINLSAHYSVIGCPEHAQTLEGVLRIIDLTAEKAELADGAVIQIGEKDIEAKQRAVQIERIVKEAVDRNLLQVYYQPIYAVKEQRFISAEALLRLNCEELGWVSPAEFVPIAEKNGAIAKMDDFVRESVCRLYQEKKLKQLGICYIDINMSVVECFQHDIVEKILETLEYYQLAPDCINMEITETAINSLPETLERNLQRLFQQGIKFSLDDYGSGYSNLTRLFELPCDMVKIDKSLIDSAFQSEAAYAVLEGTFQILRNIRKQILVEGVETEEQAQRLIAMGCDFIQGYYYAKPMSEQDFLLFLQQQQLGASAIGK